MEIHTHTGRIHNEDMLRRNKSHSSDVQCCSPVVPVGSHLPVCHEEPHQLIAKQRQLGL